MFNKIFRVINIDYTKDSKQFHIHVEGKTTDEVKELFNHAWEKMMEYEQR